MREDRGSVTTAAFYREQAEQCRSTAKCSSDRQTAMRWLQLAMEYEWLARRAEAEQEEFGKRPAAHGLTSPKPNSC
jgi:hypothetical protein